MCSTFIVTVEEEEEVDADTEELFNMNEKMHKSSKEMRILLLLCIGKKM